MGTLIGHVAPGFGFFLIGLWHLFNHTKLFASDPNKYRSLPWFPFGRGISIRFISASLRHLELYLIMLGSSMSVAMELVIGPARHTPFDPDGTIPSNHLHNFEHSSISLLFFVYAAFALILDKTIMMKKRMNDLSISSIIILNTDDVLQLVGALAFAQQLLLFHLHSSDHMGVEGQYHWLLQLIIAVSLSTTLLGITRPKSFTLAFTRSLSIIFQGLWLILMGFMLWTPSLIPKGCFMNLEEGHMVVRCHTDESLHRAKSLVNISFSWFLIALAVFAASFYLIMISGILSYNYESDKYYYYDKVPAALQDINDQYSNIVICNNSIINNTTATASCNDDDHHDEHDDLEEGRPPSNSKPTATTNCNLQTHSFMPHLGMGTASSHHHHMMER